MYPNLLELAPKCVIMLDRIIYVAPFLFHGRFEQGVVKYLSVGNGVVIDVRTTKAVVESAIEEIRINAWFVTNIKYARA